MSHLQHWLPLCALVALCAANCPEGWTDVNGSMCIKLFPEDVTAAEAEVKCQTYGLHRLRIRDGLEFDTIMKLVHSKGYQHVWTDDGYDRFAGEPQDMSCLYNVTTESPNTCLVYSFFEGADVPIKRCTAHCENRYPYACARPLVGGPGVREPTATGYSCPDKFTSWGANCYHFLPGRQRWAAECTSRHDPSLRANLKIESKMEEQYIRRTMYNLGYGANIRVWVWAKCAHKECTYQDNSVPVNHDTVNYASCGNASGNNVYWDFDSDEWRCASDAEMVTGFYSVCKTKGRRLEALPLVGPHAAILD
ncbi:hypothetical protein HDE_06065 [Halotydeus destructor]|nr:hypothetical protein HDE_06065 [Halotydeus destructor]